MSTPLEDFIISLGFDTSKLKGQIETVHKSLGKLAQAADTKRVKAGLATEKKIADNTVKVAKETSEKKKKIQEKEQNAHIVAYQKMLNKKEAADKKAAAKVRPRANMNSHVVQYQKNQKSVKSENPLGRKIAIRQARNAVAEYERSVVGASNKSHLLEQMVSGKADLSKIRNFTEDVRSTNSDTRNRMKQEGSLKSFDSASSSAADLQMLKSRTAIDSMTKQMAVLGMNPDSVKAASVSAKTLDDLKKLQIQTQAAIRDHKIQNKPQRGGANKPPVVKLDKNEVSKLFTQMQQQGAFKSFTERQRVQILDNATQQQTTRGGVSYLKTAQGLNRYGGMRGGQRQIDMGISGGTVDTLRSAKVELGKMSAEMNRLNRNSIGAAAAMNSLHHSTRNMVREYASLYAIMAGVSGINRKGQEFEAMKSSMTAAMGGVKEAQSEIQYLTEMTQNLGLSTLDVADSYAKFQFAAKGKMSNDSIRELFTGASEMGTALGISKERMKLSMNALQQINFMVCLHSNV